MGYAIKLQGGGGYDHTIMFQETVTNSGYNKSFYNDKLLTFVSGTWRTSYVAGTTNVIFTSKVSGKIDISYLYASYAPGASVIINGVDLNIQAGPNYYGYTISNPSTFTDSYTIKRGDTINFIAKIYYNLLLVYFTGR